MSRPEPTSLPLLRAALAYAAAGCAVFPVYEPTDTDCSCPASSKTRTNGICESRGKHPRTTRGFLDASTDPAVLTRWWTRWPRANIGIATGTPSAPVRSSATNPTYAALLVIDVDPRNLGDDTLRALEAEHGALPETPRVLTGGGGQHLWLVSPPGLSPLDLGQGVELKVDGRYVVAPPSRHPSGRDYVWDTSAHLDDLPLAPVPDWILRRLHERKQYPPATGVVADGLVGRAFALAGWLGPIVGEGKAAAHCPWEGGHSCGAPMNGSTVVFAPATGHSVGYWHCSHASCQGRTQEDVWQALPPTATHEAKRQLQFPVSFVPSRREEPAPPPPPGVERPWVEAIHRNAKGRMTKHPGNIALYVRHDEDWGASLTYDAFSHEIHWTKDAPLLTGLAQPKAGDDLTEPHLVYIHHWFLLYEGVDFPDQALLRGIRAGVPEVHPVRAYLEGLVWDGRPRLDIWLPQYLGTPAGRYAAFVGAKWMLSAVARILRPGCQADHMLILEGPQGSGKTSAARILASDAWHLGTLPDLRSKDALATIAGHWIVEVGELDALKGAAGTRVKDFLIQTTDAYRPAYARLPIKQPRQCVFLGTTNEEHYLRDATGGRRFWPIQCGAIDLKALRADRDQLWAEAVARYKAGEPWWPETAEHHALLEQAQDDRYDPDEWETILAEYLIGKTLTTAADCLSAVGLSKDRWSKADQMRIGPILHRLGFERKVQTHEGGNLRIWRRR